MAALPRQWQVRPSFTEFHFVGIIAGQVRSNRLLPATVLSRCSLSYAIHFVNTTSHSDSSRVLVTNCHKNLLPTEHKKIIRIFVYVLFLH